MTTRMDGTFRLAFILDVKGDFYVELDEESGCFGVFGTETGFCYGLYFDPCTASGHADRLRAAQHDTLPAPLGVAS